MSLLARDMATIVSLALQYGAKPEQIMKVLLSDEGRPATLLGHAVEMLSATIERK